MPHRLIQKLIQDQTIASVQADCTVTDASKQMKACRIGAILVIENGRLSGIFTERDALFRVIAQGLEPQNTLIGDVMTKDPQTVSADKSFGYALHLMYEGGFRHVPVVNGGVPIGMVSSRDALGPELEEFACDLRRREQIVEIL